MFKKLLQAAAVVFLLTSFAVAVLSVETLGPRTNEYYNKAHTAFLLIYFFVAAVIVWEHNASRSLKYLSAVVGLIPIVALVYAAWFDGFASRDLEARADNILFLLYIFVFVSSLASVAGRVLKLLWRLIYATVVKVNSLGRTLGLLPR
jgi:uncharacterized membrane protein